MSTKTSSEAVARSLVHSCCSAATEMSEFSARPQMRRPLKQFTVPAEFITAQHSLCNLHCEQMQKMVSHENMLCSVFSSLLIFYYVPKGPPYVLK